MKSDTPHKYETMELSPRPHEELNLVVKKFVAAYDRVAKKIVSCSRLVGGSRKHSDGELRRRGT